MLDKWLLWVYLCGMDDKLSKEELERLRLAQEADKQKVKGSWWYIGKLFIGAIKTKRI